MPILTVGKLGDGIPVPGASLQSRAIGPPLISGKCGLASNESNDSPSYEYRNPAEDAIRALINRAQSSIFLSQQDLLGCSLHHEAKFDERLFQVLATKVAQHVPIKIVLSAGIGKSGGLYQNGYTLRDLALILSESVQREHEQRLRNTFSFKQARDLVCADVGIATLRNGAFAKWADGHGFGNHAKLVSVDDRALYIGSENLYPARLQELGFIVEDPILARTLDLQYLMPMWRYSSPGAFIDPGKRCEQFAPPPPVNYYPPGFPN